MSILRQLQNRPSITESSATREVGLKRAWNPRSGLLARSNFGVPVTRMVSKPEATQQHKLSWEVRCGLTERQRGLQKGSWRVNRLHGYQPHIIPPQLQSRAVFA